MNVARQLVQGVDVWLNNPRRPQEASGTSGEKALLNGALNFSILDGWWAEAYDGTNGFAIGRGQTHAVPSVQDDRDHAALIDTLVNQVVPLYYDRDATGLPRGWIARQKNALRSLAWRFNADRMVMDYVMNCYLPAANGVSCAMIRLTPRSIADGRPEPADSARRPLGRRPRPSARGRPDPRAGPVEPGPTDLLP